MKKKRMATAIVILLLYSGAVGGIFYYTGYKIAYDRIENIGRSEPAQTFYATITDIQERNFTVQGMEENETNFRGEFWFPVDEETRITWSGTDIGPGDLSVGDHISISFTGEVLATYPGKITQVEIIRLLDDEL